MSEAKTIADRLLLVYCAATGGLREAFEGRDAEMTLVRIVTGLDDGEIARGFDEVADVPARMNTWSYYQGNMTPAERVTCLRIIGRAGVWPPGIDRDHREIELAAKLMGVEILDAAMAHDELVTKGMIKRAE